MSLFARGLAYSCAVLIAFGGVAPWVTLDGEPGGASPLGVALALLAALVVTAATAAKHRATIRVTAVFVALLAVVAIWTIPGGVLMANPSASGEASAGSGLSLLLLGGVLLYVAAWLPAPQPRAAPADA